MRVVLVILISMMSCFAVTLGEIPEHTSSGGEFGILLILVLLFYILGFILVINILKEIFRK